MYPFEPALDSIGNNDTNSLVKRKKDEGRKAGRKEGRRELNF